MSKLDFLGTGVVESVTLSVEPAASYRLLPQLDMVSVPTPFLSIRHAIQSRFYRDPRKLEYVGREDNLSTWETEVPFFLLAGLDSEYLWISLGR